MIVLDTHMFLWYVAGDERLTATVKKALEDNPGEVWVPTICLWEALILAERGRIEIKDENPGAALRRWIQQAGFQEAPLTGEIALLSRTLAFEHSDPADRFIAATAHALGARLATADDRLRKLDWIALIV